MSDEKIAQDHETRAAPPDSSLPMHGVDVPPVRVHEPVLEPHDWMDELDTNAGSMGRPAVPPAPPPPPPKKRMRWWPLGKSPKADVPLGRSEDEGTPAGVKRSMPLKPLLYASLCGIAVLGYLQYGPRMDKAHDLLGTTLPSVEPTGPTDPDLITPAIDPRLGGPDALALGPAPDEARHEQEVVQLPQAGAEPAVATPQLQAIEPTQAQVSAPARTAAPMQEPQSAASAQVAPAAGTEALDARMQRMEKLMLELSQQLAQMKTQQVPAAAPATSQRSAVQPAPMPQAEPSVAPQRTLVHAEPVRVPAARPAPVQRVAKVQQPAAKPKAAEAAEDKPAKPVALGPQLVAVDMWNGEPSVVVTSGQPGDKRMRVLRPGDVVNGMALRSADPVSRTATFVAPGSQGLTLSVNQGG